jgi:hypothetical protein
MKSSGELPEVFPTVACDVRLGEYFSTVGLDVGYLAGYLRGRGLDDGEIGGLTLRFGAENKIRDPDLPSYQEGLYVSARKESNVWLATIAMGSCLRAMKDGTPDDQLRAAIHQSVAETIAHESEHYVADCERGFVPDEAYRLADPQNKESIQQYLEQPEEVRARSVEGLYDQTQIAIG